MLGGGGSIIVGGFVLSTGSGATMAVEVARDGESRPFSSTCENADSIERRRSALAPEGVCERILLPPNVPVESLGVDLASTGCWVGVAVPVEVNDLSALRAGEAMYWKGGALDMVPTRWKLLEGEGGTGGGAGTETKMGSGSQSSV